MNKPAVVKAPVPAKKPHRMEIHGDVRVDDFFWMKERDTAPVLDYLKAENAFTAEEMAPQQALRDQLYKEIRGRVKEDDSSPPFRKGSYWYYTRYEAGKEYPILARKKGDLKAPEEILLDVNVLAIGHTFFQLGAWEISPDENMLAYGIDTTGRRFYDVYFKDLKAGTTLDTKIPKVAPNFVWANDNHTVFFVQKNEETLREERVWRFDTKDGKQDEIYFEPDDTFHLAIGRSLTDKYIYVVADSTDSTEFRIAPADGAPSVFKVVLPREKKHEYAIQDAGDVFYIKTNWKAENFRLMKATEKNLGDKTKWVEVIPHSKDVFLDTVVAFKHHLALEERTKGLTRLRVLDRNTMKESLISFPDAAYTVGIGTNEEYDAATLRYSYQSPNTPSTVFDYAFATKKSATVKVYEVPTYDPSLYVTERQWAPSHDGVLVPVTLLYKKGFKKDGTAPAHIYGYGSYGASTDPGFRGSIISLVDRGFVYVIAHVRGGQEMGRDWYEKGRLMHKKNTFKDFNAVAEFLIKNGYAHPRKLFAEGGSAGGLLMGAIANMRPDLYRGLLLGVPFVDVMTTMLDSSIPLTTFEYDQWGNPNEKAAYDYMRGYSPYDNIEKKEYPAMLVLTGYHDSQVQYWEPAKYVAKLRDLKTDHNLLLFRTEMEAGHGGASGRFKRLEEFALEFAFVLKVLELPDGEQFSPKP